MPGPPVAVPRVVRGPNQQPAPLQIGVQPHFARVGLTPRPSAGSAHARPPSRPRWEIMRSSAGVFLSHFSSFFLLSSSYPNNHSTTLPPPPSFLSIFCFSSLSFLFITLPSILLPLSLFFLPHPLPFQHIPPLPLSLPAVPSFLSRLSSFPRQLQSSLNRFSFRLLPFLSPCFVRLWLDFSHV